MIHVSLVGKPFSPDGEVWQVRRCVRSERIHTRLLGMLERAGMESDEIFPLTNRKIRDLVDLMNNWEKLNGNEQKRAGGF